MEKLKKKIINKFGTHYLLGRTYSGQKVWLEKQSWDCDWYWGFGYLHEFSNNEYPEHSRDIEAHYHFDSTFLKGPECSKDMFKKYFAETVLTDDEIWELCDLMMTFYTLKETAALFKHGYSWQSSRAKIDCIQSDPFACAINKTMLPEVFNRIEKLLSPEENN